MGRGRCFLVVTGLWWALAAGGPAEAELPVQGKVAAGQPPFAIVELLVAGNDKALPAAVAIPAGELAPAVTWLADCDPRVQPGLFLADGPGQLYSVRTLGPELTPVAAAVDFGVFGLRTPVLLITGQTDSPILALALAPERAVDAGLRRVVDRLAAVMPPGLDAGDGERLLQAAEALVDSLVAEGVARYQERVTTGRLTVVGAIIDLENRYGRGGGRLVLINVNNETDDATLRKLPIMARLDAARRALAVGRRR
ncbi:MAG: carbonic anhydrase [Thermodesulfobacteriota bacterium]